MHLSSLFDTLLEQNLLRIVEPYSVIEVEYISQQVGQARQDVETKCVLLLSPPSFIIIIVEYARTGSRR